MNQPILAATTTKPPIRRAIISLLAPPCTMLVVFGLAGTYWVVRHGLRGEAIGKALTPLAAVLTLVNMGMIFAITMWASRRDGYSLRTVGWHTGARKVAPEIAIGVAGGLLFAALNQWAFFPAIRSFPEMLPAPFDPALKVVALPLLLVTQLAGAFVEETLYRGYGLLRLRERFSVPAAVLVTAVAHALFAFAQGPVVMAWHVVIASYLAALAVWRRNLVVPFVAHLVFALIPRLMAEVG